MTVSATTSSTTATTAATTAAASAASSLSTTDFMTLLVSELQNQNPLEPTSTDKMLDQMLSYASFSQEADTSTTLENIATKLDSIVSALDITV